MSESNHNGMHPVDKDIKETLEKAKDLNKKYARMIVIYGIMAMLFFVSSIFSAIKVWQNDKAQAMAEESLVKYDSGVRKVEELIVLMQERNKMLAFQDSIIARQDSLANLPEEQLTKVYGKHKDDE